MHGASCGNCGSNEIESDQSRGDTFCIKCGSVIEENLIVSELQFEEGTHGAANLIGQMVSSDANYKSLSSNAFGSATVNSRESREITLENAKRRIKHIGQQLRLNSTCITTAFNFYRMALSKRLTYGRRQANVFAACLYMTCRLELTSHMLLDLSDITQVNIYELGKTYLRLSTALCINIPPIDPCLYIVRFAERLNKFIGIDSEKKRDIEMTALRLVQRMKRDWIHAGRRPSGLCGAALLVSCRLNGIHCNIRDIIRIVQVCETTIRKRLSEFGDTETGKLTLDEFMTVDLEGEEDPPCFKEARKKQKRAIGEIDCGQLEGFKDEVSKFQEIIDRQLEDIRIKRHRRYSNLMLPSSSEAGASTSSSNPTRFSSRLASKRSGPDSDDVIESEEVIAERFIEQETVEVVGLVLQDEGEDLDSDTLREQLELLRPTAKSLGIGEPSFANSSSNVDTKGDNTCRALALYQNGDDDDEQSHHSGGELDLEGIDDDEIESYLLTQPEVCAKTDLWNTVHAEYLNELKVKEEKQQAEAKERADRNEGPPQAKRKRTTRKKAPIVAVTAGEAIEKMLHEKRISSKINYDVLKNLS